MTRMTKLIRLMKKSPLYQRSQITVTTVFQLHSMKPGSISSFEGFQFDIVIERAGHPTGIIGNKVEKHLSILLSTRPTFP